MQAALEDVVKFGTAAPRRTRPGSLCPHPAGFATLLVQQPIQEQPTETATRACMNTIRIRDFTSRSDDSRNASPHADFASHKNSL